MYDIAIVGLGPAGSTLARMLDGRFKVLALDRRDFSAPWGKCCGGLLATDAQKSLAKFGLTLPRDVLVDPQIFAVRTVDLRFPGERYYQRFYLNLDRQRLDRWLYSMIPARVEAVEGALCKSVRREGAGYTLDYTVGKAHHSVRARVVVGADGGGSLVRRELYPDVPIRRYLAIQEWYRAEGSEPFYAALFDPQITDCYAWAVHKDGLLGVGAALPEHHPEKRFRLLLRRMEARGYRFGERVRREGCFVFRPAGMGQLVTGRDGAYLTGEAAGFISPSSLEGVSYALDSGYLLAKALNAGLRGAGGRYAAGTLPMRLRLTGKHLKNPFLYHPILRPLVMESGLAAVRMT